MTRHMDLMPDERIVLAAHPHWWYFWRQVAGGGGVLVLVTLALAWDGALGTAIGWLATLASVAWVAASAFAFLGWRTTSFVVTDRRVAYQSGLLRRRGVSIPLNRVNNVNFQQSLVARMLGNGVVTIESAGETGDSVFQNIPAPDQVRRIIFEQMQASTVAESVRSAEAVAQAMEQGPAPRPPAATAEERLNELEQLRTKGLLSDEEYADRRRRILDSL